jgi:hypothetical protein
MGWGKFQRNILGGKEKGENPCISQYTLGVKTINVAKMVVETLHVTSLQPRIVILKAGVLLVIRCFVPQHDIRCYPSGTLRERTSA